MVEQLKDVLWMAEELDFEVLPDNSAQTVELMTEFLSMTANPGMDHAIIRPEQNIPGLKAAVLESHKERAITLAIDLTGGDISNRLGISGLFPTWNDFSMSRVRMATKVELPTSGHVVSHSTEELRAELCAEDTSNILILDDTGFSGSTNIIVESLLRSAFPDRSIAFSHGFLLVNEGMLGPNPGAKHRLTQTGSKAFGGGIMHTPEQDGWHFFDLVKQQDLPSHYAAVSELLSVVEASDYNEQAEAMLKEAAIRDLIYPNILSTDELEEKRQAGRFIIAQALEDGFHTRNPQLLPNIIRQGHILPPRLWLESQDRIYEVLVSIGRLVDSTTTTKVSQT